jgi:hypothetical protein
MLDLTENGGRWSPSGGLGGSGRATADWQTWEAFEGCLEG